MDERNKWTSRLKSEVYERLCNCRSRKDDILPLTQARWSWIKEQEKYKSFSKEDALVYVLELLESNGNDYDLTHYEYGEILNSVY